MKRISLVGQTFTWIEVVENGPDYILPSGKKGSRSWCRCKCGKPELFLVWNKSLRYGQTKSCGCLRHVEQHGHAKRRTRTYVSWGDMIQRCSNPKKPGRENYGGRGLKVCAGLRGFSGFLGVLGECPPGLEIDRWPNNDTGHYSCGKCEECLANGWPLNVRWATEEQQQRNKRTNRVFTVNGITACVMDLAKHFKISHETARTRLRLGWTPEQAFTEPAKKHRNHV